MPGDKVVTDVAGFIAVAFQSNSLAVIDMRGPDVILREGFDEDGVMLKRKKRKNHNNQNVVGEKDLVATLKFVVCGMGAGQYTNAKLWGPADMIDTIARPRLIVAYEKG